MQMIFILGMPICSMIKPISLTLYIIDISRKMITMLDGIGAHQIIPNSYGLQPFQFMNGVKDLP